jgi:autotransporter translocation and assembly factor TamB
MEGTVTATLEGDIVHAECDSFTLLEIIKEGQLDIRGRLVGNRLVVDSMSVIDVNGAEAWLQGTFGLDGMDVRSRLSNFGLGLFAMLDKIIERGRGQVSGEVRAHGPYTDLEFDGRARFEKADFKLILTESPIKNASGNLVFEGKRIVLENTQGTCGEGWAKTQGYVQLARLYKMTDLELRVTFENSLGAFRPIAYGTGSGKIKIFYHKKSATYEGDVYVNEAILPLGFGTMILRKKPTGKEEPWTMKIKFTGDKNIWLKNDMADVEMAGEIFLNKTDGDVYLSGELTSRRGRVYYLDHTLTVTEGKVVFTSEPELNPMLDIRSEMPARGNITIIFRITGTFRYPVFEFFTDNAEWSEQDIITYLNLNMTWQELQEYQRRDVIGNILPRRVFEYLEAGASRRLRRATGLDYLNIETPLFSTSNQAKVTVGKYVFPNLFITYTHDVFSFAQDAFAVEYMLNNRNELLIKRSSENIYSLEYQFRIRY